jgi:DNA ligase-1
MKCFDAMYIDEWRNQNCTHDYIERRMLLEGIQGGVQHKYFEVLPELYRGDDTSKILELLDEMVAQGSEGIMLNVLDEKYSFDRTWGLQKVKKMKTLDLEIIGFLEGEGRLAGTLGAILVRYKDGNTVKVGSGFTDDLRKEIWTHQADWLGAICEIQYFETTKNDAGGESLRFPVYKDRRFDKTEADF